MLPLSAIERIFIPTYSDIARNYIHVKEQTQNPPESDPSLSQTAESQAVSDRTARGIKKCLTPLTLGKGSKTAYAGKRSQAIRNH